MKYTPNFFSQKEVESDALPQKNEPLTLDDHLVDFENPWFRVTHLLRLNLFVFAILLSSTNNGYDGSMLNGFQSLSHWMNRMGNPKGAILGALTSGTTWGNVLALPLAPYLADRYGRRKTVAMGQAICIIGAVLQGASVNYAMFLIARMVLGFGAMMAGISSPAWISEIAYPSHRQVATTFYNTSWYLGAILAAWVTYGTNYIHTEYSWRVPSYLQAVLPIVQLSAVYFIPESPRYLVSRGRLEEARSMLLTHHGGGDEGKCGGMIEYELCEIEAAIQIDLLDKHMKYTDFFRTAANRKRLFYIIWVSSMMQLSGNGLVSYYLVKVLESIGITSANRQLVLNGGLMIYNWGIAIIVACCAGSFKRRAMFLTSLFFMCLFYVLWTILSAINQQRHFEDKLLASGVLAMIFLYYIAYNIGMNGLPLLYITEILPYHMRSKGLSVLNLWTSVTLVYNAFVNSVAMDAITWKYYIVYCCVVGVEFVVVYFTFIETAGYSLEEVCRVFGEELSDLPMISVEAEKPTESHLESVTHLDGDEHDTPRLEDKKAV